MPSQVRRQPIEIPVQPTWRSPPNGDIYVGDGYGSSYILQYNSKGEYIRTFGGPGKEAGQLLCPHGIILGRARLRSRFSMSPIEATSAFSDSRSTANILTSSMEPMRPAIFNIFQERRYGGCLTCSHALR